MVMALFRGMCYPGPLVLSCDSVREAKCTRLGYETKLSRLYTLNPPLAVAFSRSSHLVIPDHKQENNQRALHKSQVHQADPPVTVLNNSNHRRDREKVTNHMRDKYEKET
jgi:hypothetical protein